MQNFNFNLELKRKIIHIAFIWIPIICFWYGPLYCSYIIYAFLALALIIELIKNFPSYNPIFKAVKILNLLNIWEIFRTHEKESLSGASFLLIGASILINLVNSTTFILAYSISIIADSAAALFGKKWGQIKLINNKTLEGSIAFFASSLITIIFLSDKLDFTPEYALLALVSTTFAELFAKKIKVDYNLLIPAVFCLTLEFLNKINF